MFSTAAFLPMLSGMEDGKATEAILIVEDDRDLRAGLEVLVRDQGYETVAVASGEDAFPALESRKFCVCLLDLMLPGMNGFEILKKLRADPRYSLLPVIMITAEPGDEKMLTGYRTGADYYISKPFTAEQIAYGLNLCLTED